MPDTLGDRLRHVLAGLIAPLLRYARARCVTDAHVAADVVQDALAAALAASANRQRDWEDEDALWKWLTGVVRNKLADEHRRYRVRFPSASALGINPDEILDVLRTGDRLPDSLAQRAEVRELCRFAIQELPPRRREVLRRFYLEGESQSQIAEATGTTVRGVESLLGRSRQQLHRVLTRIVSSPEELL